jgi:hypothetical protein
MDLSDRQCEALGNISRWSSDDPRVHQVIHAAELELRDLLQQRSQIVKRIGTMKQTIMGLAKLFGDDVFTDELQDLLGQKTGARTGGLTNTCRILLMESVRPLTAREVCDHLERRMSPVLARHKDPLASVTTILNRLAQYGEAKPVFLGDGRRAWEWASEAQQLLGRRQAERFPRHSHLQTTVLPTNTGD